VVDAEVIDAEVVDEDPAPAGDPEPITGPQLKALQALLAENRVIGQANRHQFLSKELGRKVTSTKQVTKQEAGWLIDGLSGGDQWERPPEPEPGPGPEPGPELEPEPEPGPDPPATPEQVKGLGTLIKKLNLGAAEGLALYRAVAGRDVPSTKDLSIDEAMRVHSALLAMIEDRKREEAAT
jgi:hypothetical protein